MSTDEEPYTTETSSDASSVFDMQAGVVAVLGAYAMMMESPAPAVGLPLHMQDLTGCQWVELNLDNTQRTKQCVRQVAERFRRSLSTVTAKLSEVTDAMFSWSHTQIAPADRFYSRVHPTLEVYAPFFDGCIGAIDGTHIKVRVRRGNRDDYMNRKRFTSVNVLAVVDMDQRFTYVGAGAAGACHDMAILKECMQEAAFPHPPIDRYYLVDSGFTLQKGYMPPFRSCRYHITEFEGRDPETVEEIFNYHHAKLQNVVERAFGVLKNKWQILEAVPLYPKKKQTKMILACFALHNFLLNDRNGTPPGQLPKGPRAAWVQAQSHDDMGNVRQWIASCLALGTHGGRGRS
ncbi:hypothetical protein ACP4OV_014630 [Aristida adscensionis]